jgi:RNA polymerase sigma-70 factor (ECF subfamily)
VGQADTGFRDLYEREFAAVFRAAYVVSGDRDAAEDATQEAFARALARWRRLGKEPRVAGWVMTTAINVARRQRRRRPTVETSRTQEPDVEAALDLRRAISGLTRRQQEAVVLHHLLGLPLHEAAQAMGCQEGTVKAHLSRARATLADSLEAREPS